jgi:hypothetical protein
MVVVLFALFMFLPSSAVLAHPCDDNYTEQQDKEDCWWRFWNEQSTEQDMMMSDMMSGIDMSTYVPLDGTLCNTQYTEQQDKEDCWWRYWNSVPPMDMDMDMDMDMESDKDMMSGDGGM